MTAGVEATQDFLERVRTTWRAPAAEEVEGGLEAQDCWTLLGLQPGANKKEVESRWRRIAHAYHPDTACRGCGDDTMFKILRAAYEEAMEQINERTHQQ